MSLLEAIWKTLFIIQVVQATNEENLPFLINMADQAYANRNCDQNASGETIDEPKQN